MYFYNIYSNKELINSHWKYDINRIFNDAFSQCIDDVLYSYNNNDNISHIIGYIFDEEYNYAYVCAFLTIEKMDDKYMLWNVCTKTSERNNKIMSRLLTEILKIYIDKPIELYISKDGNEAKRLRFYERLGFYIINNDKYIHMRYTEK